MAELHQALLVRFRKQLLSRRYKEGKSPMPTFRPDIFCQKISSRGNVLEEVVVEAEIESTLYSEHTSNQLVIMDEYISHSRKKHIKVSGYLLLPKSKKLLSQAHSLLDSLFPGQCNIKVKQLSA